MRRFPTSYIFLCVNFAFILNTLHCDAYRRDSVVKFQNQLQKLHTSATSCCHLLQKLDYCLITRALKIKWMIPPKRWNIFIYVSCLVQIILILIWPHPTVLQTSATNSQFWEVAKFSTETTVMDCKTGKYIQHQNKNKPYHMKERLISYQLLDLFIYVQFDHTFPCCIVVTDVNFFNQCRKFLPRISSSHTSRNRLTLNKSST